MRRAGSRPPQSSEPEAPWLGSSRRAGYGDTPGQGWGAPELVPSSRADHGGPCLAGACAWP